jgi:hypothetical protein
VISRLVDIFERKTKLPRRYSKKRKERDNLSDSYIFYTPIDQAYDLNMLASRYIVTSLPFALLNVNTMSAVSISLIAESTNTSSHKQYIYELPVINHQYQNDDATTRTDKQPRNLFLSRLHGFVLDLEVARSTSRFLLVE